MQLAIPLPQIPQNEEASPNQLWRSVPGVLAIAVQFLTGQPVSAATLKDLVYGSTYTGLTAPAAYLDECARRGVTLWSAGGESRALLKVIRTQLKKQHPVLATVVDQHTDLTGIPHPILFYGMDEPEGTMTAIDPTTGSTITCTDAGWAALLRVPEIWIAQKTRHTLIQAGWRDDGLLLIAPNGGCVTGAFREYILESTNHWHPDNWPLEQEHDPIALFEKGQRGTTRQCFRWTLLCFTPPRGVFIASIGEAFLSYEKALQHVETLPKCPERGMRASGAAGVWDLKK